MSDEDSPPIYNWTACPSFANSDMIFKNSVYSVIYAARRAAMFRIATISQRDIFTNEQRKVFMSKPDDDFIPLFQQVPASVIQIITNSLHPIFLNPDAFVEKTFEFFDSPKGTGEGDKEKGKDKGKQYTSDFFAALTFPALFFYFQTSEFSEFGAKFLKKAIHIKRGKFLVALLSAYFDNFPRFLEMLIDQLLYFASGGKVSIFMAFKNALVMAFAELTKNHRDIVEELAQIDKVFLCQFFFMYYFPQRVRCVFGNSEDHDTEGIGKQLGHLFDYCTFHDNSPHVNILLDSILSIKHFRSHALSYGRDIGLPTVFMVLSGLETKILFDLFVYAGLIKNFSKLSSLTIPTDKANSLAPGHVQFSHRKFLDRPERTEQPILFDNDGEVEMKIDPSEGFARSYAQLKKMAREEGQTILQLLDNPSSMRVKKQISSLTIAKSPEFRQFIQMKLEKKMRRSECEFESFIGKMATQKELELLERDFLRDADLYIRTAARDFMEKKCILTGTVVPECLKLKPRPGVEFMAARYPFMNVEPKEMVVYKQKNSMKNKSFDVMLKILSPKEVLPAFIIEFMLSMVNEWKEESKELRVALHNFLESERNEYYVNGSFAVYEKSKFAKYAVAVLRKLNRARVGILFNRMSKLFIELDEINKYYYAGTRESFAEVCMHIILMACADNAVICLLWYTRLVVTETLYVKLMDQRTQELWKIASDQMWVLVSKKDGHLMDLVLKAFQEIPLLD